jgi:hypothetical protein
MSTVNVVAEAAYLMSASNYLDGTLHEDHRKFSFKRDFWGGYTFAQSLSSHLKSQLFEEFAC